MPGSEPVLYRNARVWSPQPLGVVDILTGAGTILAIGPGLEGVSMPGLSVRDLGGATVIPGFVDPHLHLGGGGGEGGFASRIDPARPQDLAKAGITTAVGVLGTDSVTRSLGDLHARAHMLDAFGLQGFMYTGSYRLPLTTLTGSVQTDLVLVQKVLAVGEVAIGDHRGSQATIQELARLAAESRVGGMIAGKPAPLHLHLGDRIQGIEMLAALIRDYDLPARQYYPTHLNRSTDLLEAALPLLRAGMPFDLTAGFADSGTERSAATMARHLLDLGLPPDSLTISSDSYGSMPVFDKEGTLLSIEAAPPSLLHDEFKACLARDIPFATAVALFTRNPARILGIGRTGELRTGFRADFLILGNDGDIRETVASGRTVAVL